MALAGPPTPPFGVGWETGNVSGAAGGRWRWTLTSRSPCCARRRARRAGHTPGSAREDGARGLQGGPTLRLCCSLGRGRSLGRPVPFRVQESLRSHLPRAAPGALRSSPSHTSPLWKALLSNGLGAPRHFLAGLYLHFSLCLWSVSPTNIQAPGEQEPVHHRGCVPTAGPAARTLWVLGGC